MSPARRRLAVDHARNQLGVSERRACRVLGQSRRVQRYEPKESDDEKVLRERIISLAREYGRYGYRRITAMLRAEGWQVNPQARGTDLAAGGPESAEETTEAWTIVAERRLVRVVSEDSIELMRLSDDST